MTISPHSTDEPDFDDLDIDHGIIVVADGMAWGPFEVPEHALRFALRHKPDMLFKLHVLMNPDILSDS